MPFILALLRERSASTPKQYGKEFNESLIPLWERLVALLSLPFVNFSQKKNHKS